MKPVLQTTFGLKGNCFQACVASILELPLEQVPNFCQDDPEGWWDQFRDWLVQYELCPVCVTVPPQWQGEGELPLSELPRTYYILSGKSPRGDHLHSIVVYEGESAHDPHRSDRGLCSVADAIFFVPLYPERQILN